MQQRKSRQAFSKYVQLKQGLNESRTADVDEDNMGARVVRRETHLVGRDTPTAHLLRREKGQFPAPTVAFERGVLLSEGVDLSLEELDRVLQLLETTARAIHLGNTTDPWLV